MSLSAAELRRLPILADLGEEELGWLVGHGQVREYPAGSTVMHDGEAAEWMYLLLEGELVFYWAASGDAPYATRAGDVVGVLPYSRLSRYNGYGVAERPLRVLAFHRDQFPALLQAIPALGPRLVSVLLDRVRYITRLDLREEKLISLGKLSAGLAHELGNPASAARRAAAHLREAQAALEAHTLALVERLGVAGARRLLEEADGLRPLRLGAVEQGDLEEALGGWLERHGVERAWELAPGLAEAGVQPLWLEGLGLPEGALSPALHWLEAHLATRALAHDVEASASRVLEIVQVVKRYTHMDQAPKQAVDLRQGLEDALALFAHRLRDGVRVERCYAPDLPPVEAFVGELNQVWSHLLDNALDAMGGRGVLRVRTAREGGWALVEVADSGPGVPPELQDRIFDPFFTTKGVGQGRGLGLDIVRRVVQQHRGTLRLLSTPGDTRFQVRLPLGRPEG